MRLDLYLQEKYPERTRATLQRLIKNGKVLINKEPAKKNGHQLKTTDKVKVNFDQVIDPKTLEQPVIDVLYEDKDCVVIDKPLGLLTHSKGEFNAEATVATWLETRDNFKFDTDDGNSRAGIVHRLDRATSGVMICAKNPTALRHLQKQFQDRKAKKTYIARIEGRLKPDKAIIDLPIERNPKMPQRFRVGQNGKHAVTHYSTVAEIPTLKGKFDSLIELKPTTGRTHQLRVHLNYLKHPIIGDLFYDGRKAKRLYLHAKELEITIPNKKRETFIVDTPEDFNSSEA